MIEGNSRDFIVGTCTLVRCGSGSSTTRLIKSLHGSNDKCLVMGRFRIVKKYTSLIDNLCRCKLNIWV